MRRPTEDPGPHARKLTCFGLGAVSLLAAQFLFMAPASACGNAMRVIAPGVMFWLVLGWLTAGAISSIFVYFDKRRTQPLSTRNRRLAVLAIFAALTATLLLHYGTTFDVEDWRLFDHKVRAFGVQPYEGEITF